MNAADKYDVVVLGGGTGGKLMARTVAQEGHERQTTKG
jgi:pyruvate/2-oxoglutarate dehydrogenase complex dihydrolipoamide dehydrogenase (E3) component